MNTPRTDARDDWTTRGEYGTRSAREITLEVENARLRDALQRIIDECNHEVRGVMDEYFQGYLDGRSDLRVMVKGIAREALDAAP